MPVASAKRLSDRERSRRTQKTVEALVKEIPAFVAAAVERATRPLRMELDVLSLIVHEKLAVTPEEATEYRKKVLVLQVQLEAAARAADGLSALGLHPEIATHALNYQIATGPQIVEPTE